MQVEQLIMQELLEVKILLIKGDIVHTYVVIGDNCTYQYMKNHRLCNQDCKSRCNSLECCGKLQRNDSY